MADTIDDYLMIYRVYITRCKDKGNDDYTCRIWFGIDVFISFFMLFVFIYALYLVKKDRDDNRHEE